MRKLFNLFLFLLSSIPAFCQVALQTGESVFSFPMFSYSSSTDRLQSVIALNYRSEGGIRANYIAPNVGTGWMLTVGGEISRTVIGQPDDQKYVSTVSPDDYIAYPQTITGQEPRYYPDGYLYTSYSADDDLTKYSTYVPLGNIFSDVGKSRYDESDRQQDIFYYSFNGRSGAFVIGKDWVARPVQDCGLKFSLLTEDMSSSYIRTRIKSFKITDETGIDYYFEEKELLHAMRYTDRNASITPPIFDSESSFYAVRYKANELPSTVIRKVVSKWFLTKIENPMTSQTIQFHYDDEGVDYFGAKHGSVTMYQSPNRYQFLFERIKVDTKRLSSITLNSAEEYQFEYSSTQRVDMPGSYALTKVKYVRSGILVSGYELKYGYLFKNELKDYDFNFSATDKRYARLALTEIRSVGLNNESKIASKFSYYLNVTGVTTICPPQFFMDADSWGFYNKHSGGMYDLEYDDGGPTQGGYNPFSYQVRYDNQQSIGLLKEIQNGLGGIGTFEYEQNTFPTNSTNPLLMGSMGGVRVKKYIFNDGISENVTEYKYVDENGFSSRWGEETPVHQDEITIRQYIVPGDDYRPRFSLGNSLLIGWGMGSLGRPMYFLQNNEVASTLVSLAGPWGNAVSPIVDLLLSLFTDPYKDFSSSRCFLSNKNLANPLAPQYRRVEVHQKGTGSGNYGKVAHTFTSDIDFPLLVPELEPPYSPKLRAAPWIYGLPLSEEVFDAGNVLKKKTEYSYNNFLTAYADANNKSASYYSDITVAAEFNRSLGYNAFGGTPVLKEVYYPYHGRVELEQIKTRLYDPAGGYSEEVTRYYYNSDNFLLSRKEKDLHSDRRC